MSRMCITFKIISLDEDNNLIIFNCTKNKHNKNKMPVIEYLNKIKEIKKLDNLSEFKDQCENHKNNYYISYCFDCNNHLCKECLKIGNHINHKKNNIIEIQPIDSELKIISEIINSHKNELENLKKEKEAKIKW